MKLMLCVHGYEPMSMLDDNCNGWLEGNELSGLSVWQDRNSNGVSDMGEVESVATLASTACLVSKRAG